MIYLTVAQVLFLHSRLITETGGGRGVRDLGLLEAAAARPQATFGGDDLYPDLFAKAAALLESLLRNHPFVDGNKRAAVAAAGLLLRRNAWRLATTDEELVAFILRITTDRPDTSEVTTWLRDHSAPVEKPGDVTGGPLPQER